MESSDITLLVVIIASILGSAFIFYIIVGGFNKKSDKTPIAPEPKKPVINPINDKQKHLFPIRLQAYERIVLFLEKIEPSSLVMRNKTNEMSAQQLHSTLLNNIREEYELNVSQQIYISDNAWNLTKQAKEETIKIINLAANSVEEKATGNDLTRNIFEKMMVLPKSPSEIALEYVKTEIKSIL